MADKKSIEAFYSLINSLYSLNYSGLKFSKQYKKQYETKGFEFSMPFFKKESWIDAKLGDVNEKREEFFAKYYEIDSESQEQYKIIDDELEKSKDYLQYIYCMMFRKLCSFEEIFDGFLCKAPDLLGYIYMFEMQPCVTNNPDVKKLMKAYSTYTSNLYYKTITSTLVDMIEQLASEFNSIGTPNFSYGFIQNEKIVKISADKIREMRKNADELHGEIDSHKPKKHSGNAYTKSMATEKYKKLNIILRQLEERLKSANTDFFHDITNRVVETTMDYLTGVGLDKKPEVSEIYVTKQELNYIEYLTEMIKYALAVLNEKTKDDKQKGDA